MSTTKIYSISDQSITARELKFADLPDETLQGLCEAAFLLKIMIDEGRVALRVDTDTEAEESMTILCSQINDAWMNHSKPCSPDCSSVERLIELKVGQRAPAVPQSSGASGGMIAGSADSASGGPLRFHPSPESLARRDVAEAMAEANHLLSLYGDDDPRALAAVVRAVNLAEPGLMDKALAECGIHLPEATHVNDAGEPMYSIDQVAQTLQVDPAEIAEKAAEMADVLGQPLLVSGGSRIQ